MHFGFLHTWLGEAIAYFLTFYLNEGCVQVEHICLVSLPAPGGDRGKSCANELNPEFVLWYCYAQEKIHVRVPDAYNSLMVTVVPVFVALYFIHDSISRRV